MEGLTTKVLNERLTKLYKFGIIDKIIYPETPPKVEYNFTEFGQKFLQIVDVVENLQSELNKRGSPLAPLDTICSIEEFYG